MDLILGTAMWGWTMPKKKCFQLLDHYYEKGFRQIDAATNYPINKIPKDFRRAEQILEEWILQNGISDLRIIMKVGSLNNLRTPDHNLSKSFLLMNLDEYKFKFGNNLDSIMVHWDNRTSKEEIEMTFEAFQIINDQGFKLGLSGIKRPDIYHQLNQKTAFDFRIQIKHNLLYSDYERYHFFHGNQRFIAYGINAGGLKLDLNSYHQNSSLNARGGDTQVLPPLMQKLHSIIPDINKNSKRVAVTNFNQIAMIYAFHSPDIGGILVGPSKLQQMEGTIEIFEALKNEDFADVVPILSSIKS